MAFLLGITATAQKNVNGIVQTFLSGNAEEVGLKTTDVA